MCVLLCSFELCVIESTRKSFILLSLHFFKLCYSEREMKGIEHELLKEFKKKETLGKGEETDACCNNVTRKSCCKLR